MDPTSNKQIPQAVEKSELPHPAASPSVADGQCSSLGKSLEKIARHRQVAYQSQNTQVAVLGGVSADLLEVEARVAHTLREILSGDEWTAEDIEANAGGVDMMIRLAKQVAQLEQLQQRISSVTYIGDPFKFAVRP